jgi:hypothetical protein
MFDILPAWAFVIYRYEVEEPVEETAEDTATADNEPAKLRRVPLRNMSDEPYPCVSKNNS